MKFIWILGFLWLSTMTYFRYLSLEENPNYKGRYTRIIALITIPINGYEAAMMSMQLMGILWITFGLLFDKFIFIPYGPYGLIADLINFIAAFGPMFLATAFLRWILIPRIPKG